MEFLPKVLQYVRKSGECSFIWFFASDLEKYLEWIIPCDSSNSAENGVKTTEMVTGKNMTECSRHFQIFLLWCNCIQLTSVKSPPIKNESNLVLVFDATFKLDSSIWYTICFDISECVMNRSKIAVWPLLERFFNTARSAYNLYLITE